MLVITLQTLKEHETTLKQSNMFPTSANETVKILKSYKENEYSKMDEETRKFLDDLLNEWGEKYFSFEEE